MMYKSVIRHGADSENKYETEGTNKKITLNYADPARCY